MTAVRVIQHDMHALWIERLVALVAIAGAVHIEAR